MRLWHKDLVSRLPDKQLRGQWRECILIAKALKEGNLNHIIVNRVKEYPLAHYIRYCQIVAAEMHRRGYKADWALLWRTLDKNGIARGTLPNVITTSKKNMTAAE